MEIQFLVDNFDASKDILSEESAQKTKAIIERFSNELRFKYDSFKKIISSDEFNIFAEKYISMGQAKDKKQMISHMSAILIQIMADEIKTDFINLLDV